MTSAAALPEVTSLYVYAGASCTGVSSTCNPGQGGMKQGNPAVSMDSHSFLNSCVSGRHVCLLQQCVFAVEEFSVRSNSSSWEISSYMPFLCSSIKGKCSS